MPGKYQTSKTQLKPLLSTEQSSTKRCMAAEKKAINVFKRLAQERRAPQHGWEHPAIKRAKDYLEAHYAEVVALHDLARVAHLSPFHLSRLFRQTIGLPPHAYQTQLRLARARTLLAHGYDVGYVAAETGFFDQSHFTQQFQRHFCVTPGSYRKTARCS